jgi:hypothetical protein
MISDLLQPGSFPWLSLIIRRPSALGKNDPFVLTKSDPHQEHDLPVGKEGSDIIHAVGVRVSSRCRLISAKTWYWDVPV